MRCHTPPAEGKPRQASAETEMAGRPRGLEEALPFLDERQDAELLAPDVRGAAQQ